MRAKIWTKLIIKQNERLFWYNIASMKWTTLSLISYFMRITIYNNVLISLNNYDFLNDGQKKKLKNKDSKKEYQKCLWTETWKQMIFLKKSIQYRKNSSLLWKLFLEKEKWCKFLHEYKNILKLVFVIQLVDILSGFLLFHNISYPLVIRHVC